jgi:hypothetical protein
LAAIAILAAGAWLRAERVTVVLSNIALGPIRLNLDQEDKTFPFPLSVTDSVPDRWKGRAHRHHPQGSITELPAFPEQGVLIVKPGVMEIVLDSAAIRPGGLTLRFKVAYEDRPELACDLMLTARVAAGGELSVNLIGLRQPDHGHTAIITRESQHALEAPGSVNAEKVAAFHFGGFHFVPDPTRPKGEAGGGEAEAAQNGTPGVQGVQVTGPCSCVIL